ncbi:MAG: hypothetical protein EBZ48_01435 [Proteobacteria bacterium]|nr:hypothetical protein [Pseudomonadota bacterium]
MEDIGQGRAFNDQLRPASITCEARGRHPVRDQPLVPGRPESKLELGAIQKLGALSAEARAKGGERTSEMSSKAV